MKTVQVKVHTLILKLQSIERLSKDKRLTLSKEEEALILSSLDKIDLLSIERSILDSLQSNINNLAVRDLRQIASSLNVNNWWKLTKEELIENIQRRRNPQLR